MTKLKVRHRINRNEKSEKKEMREKGVGTSKSQLSPKKQKKSMKGALIKGMTKKLPSEIIDNPVFKRKLKEIMKGFSGIYALYHKENIYYVGLAKNLLNRISWHLKDRHANKWDTFVIFRIKRVNYLKDIETLITHLIDIPANRSKGKVPPDADINRILREILKKHESEIKDIKRAIKR